ncbi:MAG: DUF6036 family nucleotidyltransferase [Alteromonas sp.]|jgi:hypothetical protein|uniref:DUF6036 family nucleotidyltransferase n=1 Tax=Alteromonas sp. TaxID=232 RepID=UPI000B62F079|nr:DUF6036 family nucleotidyltransferase [Alteromonas sp.]MAI37683.1 hypothetical protein [Alteromonas sp.]OUX87553.1 MAG: hypothetical protein CBB95_08840 [Alteromonas sp. TMED35]|tara:strand:+ start:2580 stop:3170 length:591 start_codon:yes stop_codon:yes gene_type:complete
MDLYLDTPLSKAVFELLKQLNDEIELQLTDTDKAGLVKVYIFGGCAVHMYTNARGSNDLDVEVEATEKLDIHSLAVELDTVYFTDPVDGLSQLDLDDTFQIGITPVVFPDYKHRAIPLNEGKQKLHIYLVSPLDIVVSKLSRCATDDIKDIVEIYKRGSFTLDEFKDAANEALDYTATPDSLQVNIDYVILKLENV